MDAHGRPDLWEFTVVMFFLFVVNYPPVLRTPYLSNTPKDSAGVDKVHVYVYQFTKD